MKRRAVLRSLVTVPAAAIGISGSQPAQEREEKTALRENGAPAGPPLVAPGPSEFSVTPVSTADSACDMQARTFDARQYAALSKLCELIAPSRGDIPGAREGDVAAFLDFLVGASPTKTADLYRQGLDQLNEEARQRYGKAFEALDIQAAHPILAPLEEPWQFRDPDSLMPRFLRTVRGDIIRATFNSRSYIDAISQTRRSRQGSGFYWYPML